MNASTKRQTALGMLTELYLPAHGTEHEFLWESCDDRLATGAEVADNIEKLMQLGRTARWQSAISLWARSVRENSGNPRGVRFAYLQGLVHASHAS